LPRVLGASAVRVAWATECCLHRIRLQIQPQELHLQEFSDPSHPLFLLAALDVALGANGEFRYLKACL
jgi:hypothetical protein